MMAAVRSKNTRAELALRHAVHKRGIRYRVHVKDVFGRPDLAIKRYRIAVFVDGDMWHGNEHKRRGLGSLEAMFPTNTEFWCDKIRRNMERDRLVDERLALEGWHTIRFWATDVVADPDAAARVVEEAVRRWRQGGDSERDFTMGLTETFSQGCGLFEFDISTPLFEQMCSDFDDLTPVPLNETNLAGVGEKPGVYGLHHKGRLVYVGKADESARMRLRKHWGQLHGRIGIAPDEVSFRCLHFARTWDAFKPEAHMIERYQPSWNKRGFGPNDPGRRRDTTNLADDHWHVRYPLDPDYACSGVPAGQYDILELLRLVAKGAPYWVRFQGNREGRSAAERAQHEAAHADFGAASPIVVPRDGTSVRQLLELAVRGLPNPDAWQLTQLPSHILLYRESDATYPRMTRLWPPID